MTSNLPLALSFSNARLQVVFGCPLLLLPSGAQLVMVYVGCQWLDKPGGVLLVLAPVRH